MKTKKFVFFFLLGLGITCMSCKDTISDVVEVTAIAEALEDTTIVWGIKQFSGEDGAKFVYRNITILYSNCEKITCHTETDLDINGISILKPKRGTVSGEAYDVLYPLLTERYETYVASKKEKEKEVEESEKVIRIE